MVNVFRKLLNRQICAIGAGVFALMSFVAISAHAQAPTWDWASSGMLIGTNVGGFISTYGVGADGTGNVYFGGAMADSMHFGSNHFKSAGGTDIFVAKTNSSGVIQWAKRYGTSNGDMINDLIVDNSGNMYAQIFYFATGFTIDGINPGGLVFGAALAKFDGNGTCTIAKTPQQIGFTLGGIHYDPSGFIAWANNTTLAKINMSCDTVWTRNITTGLNVTCLFYDVTTDPSGNLIACGSFGGTVNFGNGVTITSPTNAELDNFVVKYNTNGTAQWARAFGARHTFNENANSVACDQGGHIYVIGSYVSKMGIGTDTITNGGNFSTSFLLKYSPGGAVEHIMNATSTNQNFGRKVVCDPNNNIWVALNPAGTVTFAGQDHIPSTSSGTMLISIDTAGVFRARLKTSGLGLSDPHALSFNSAGTAMYVGGWHVSIPPTTSVVFGATTMPTSGCYVAKATPGVTTDVAADNEVPSDFTLDQNYPNPFNPTTTIAYTLTERTPVRLEVYNLTGQLVDILVDKQQSAGSHTVEWDGRDANGIEAASGVYFYRLSTLSSKTTRKMMLLR